MKRIGFFGFGRRAISFVDNFRALGLADRVRFAGVFDVNPERARRQASDRHVDMPVFSDPKEMLEKSRPDAVIIASYDAAHLECFRHLRQSPVPVMVEKPLEISVGKAADFVSLAREYKAPVLVAHNMRFAPILQRAKAIIEEGRIGRVNSFRFHNNVHYGHEYFRRWMRKRENVGDAIVEKGSHDMDILHMLLNSRSSSVFCTARRFEFGGDKPDDLRCPDCPAAADCRDNLQKVYWNVLGKVLTEGARPAGNDLCVYAKESDIYDDHVCLIQLENGSQGTYVQTLYTPYSFKSRIYTLVGSLGILEIDLDEHEGDLHIYPRYGSKKEFAREHFDYRTCDHYNGDPVLTRHFYDVMCGNALPACTVEDGYYAVAASVSAAASADQKRPVEVPSLPTVSARGI